MVSARRPLRPRWCAYSAEVPLAGQWEPQGSPSIGRRKRSCAGRLPVRRGRPDYILVELSSTTPMILRRPRRSPRRGRRRGPPPPL
ncbi:hypothetical protein NDU88_007546 [Pleurodeles waltl]|uniref:Uncharacterized protein n=1 Tax=Pleurodeles waltl TaxID=8319 RepID=A0AAV7SSZ4_PLEWA|nr:hypothetical protein NDU88_007546 [Pleurodeles waltl]